MSGAWAALTAPSAQKLYRARSEQIQEINFQVETATLEWLPQETIAYSGAKGRLNLSADVDPGGRFMGWEVLALGEGPEFSQGSVISAINITRSGDLVFWERREIAVPAKERFLKSPLGWATRPVAGLFWALGRASSNADTAKIDLAKEDTAKNDIAKVDTAKEEKAKLEKVAELARRKTFSGDGLFGITVRDDGLLLARYLGPSAEMARERLDAVRSLTREAWGGAVPYSPRIWTT
jgi:urease accessory protein